jgi:hypothetical protein
VVTFCVRGCLKWQEDGLGEPEAVSIATADYRREMDVMADFIEEQCVLGEQETVNAGLLYLTFQASNSGLQILWPDTSNQLYQEELQQAAEGGCANNISAIVQCHLKDGPSILWMGDLETCFMEDLDPIPVAAADILFAPHHGRDSGRVPATWLEKIKPKLIVVGEAPAEHLHYYPGYNTITQNSAGDITLDCDTGRADIFVSDWDYSVGFLKYLGLDDDHGGKYIGTLIL